MSTLEDSWPGNSTDQGLQIFGDERGRVFSKLSGRLNYINYYSKENL